MVRRFFVALSLVAVTGCPTTTSTEPGKEPAAANGDAAVTPAPAPTPRKYDALSRSDFNFRAQELFLPLFWRADEDGNKAISPNELAVLWGPQNAGRADYGTDKAFTKKFDEAYDLMVKGVDFAKADEAEKKRLEALKLELSQGVPTLVEYDATAASAQDKAILQHVTKAAVLVEKLYARQLGSDALAARVPADSLSQAVFFRNQGPWCVAPKTEKDPTCTAIPGGTKRLSGLYPVDIQTDEKFCAKLEKEKNHEALMGHFSAVQVDGKGFKAVPYSEMWKDDMEAVANELDEAAGAVTSDDEKALKTYLAAAAKAFRTNDWEPANVAWVAMGSENSKWYLRIGPDEVYYEPCAWKAGFAVSFARINLESLAWQKKLAPVKQEMEEALAKLGGAPYKARQVKFKLPDFIDVVLNTGDQRHTHGAAVGESLPNWGPTAQKGGRTMVMSNLYTDADSKEQLKTQMSSLFCPETFKKAVAEAAPQTMMVVLHEAAHNLGPSHDYKVKGKDDDAVFGGPLAATMEELKAQSSALFFTQWLVGKGVVKKDEAEAAQVRELAWAFGHISRGMYDGAGKPKNYSQLASIQLGSFSKAGALVWKKADKAANGTDEGCFELDFSKWNQAVEAVEKRVVMAKARGDKKDAEKMRADFVDAKDDWSKTRDVIAERWLRAPKATFVFSVKR
jgi:hypothetical protein